MTIRSIADDQRRRGFRGNSKSITMGLRVHVVDDWASAVDWQEDMGGSTLLLCI